MAEETLSEAAANADIGEEVPAFPLLGDVPSTFDENAFNESWNEMQDNMNDVVDQTTQAVEDLAGQHLANVLSNVASDNSKNNGGGELFPHVGVTLRLKGIGKGQSGFMMGNRLKSLLERHRDGPAVIVIQNISYVEQDVYLPVLAVDDHRVLYRFGRNFGQFSFQCVAYIMNCDPKIEILLNDIKNAFEDIRLASVDTPENINACGLQCKVYWHKLEMGSVDNRAHSITFTITAIVAPKTNGGAD